MKEKYIWKQPDGTDWVVEVDFEKLTIDIESQDFHRSLGTREALDVVVENFIKVVAVVDKPNEREDADFMYR